MSKSPTELLLKASGRRLVADVFMIPGTGASDEGLSWTRETVTQSSTGLHVRVGHCEYTENVRKKQLDTAHQKDG
jgi:hypothetical protein